MVKCDFQSLGQEEFVLPGMSQKGVAGLALVDHSGIIQPVATKLMKKCMADDKIFVLRYCCLDGIQRVINIFKNVITKLENLSKYRFNFVDSEFYLSSTYMATLKVV